MKEPLIDLQDILLYTVVKDKKAFVCKLAKVYDTNIEYINSVMDDIKYIRDEYSPDGLKKLLSEIYEKEPPIELNILGDIEYNAEDNTDNIAKLLVNLICFRNISKIIKNSSNMNIFKKFIYEEFEDIDFETKYEDIDIDTLFSYITNDIVKLYNFFKQKFSPAIKKYVDTDLDSIIDAYFWPTDELAEVPYLIDIKYEIKEYRKYITEELSDKVLALCLVHLYSEREKENK